MTYKLYIIGSNNADPLYRTSIVLNMSAYPPFNRAYGRCYGTGNPLEDFLFNRIRKQLRILSASYARSSIATSYTTNQSTTIEGSENHVSSAEAHM